MSVSEIRTLQSERLEKITKLDELAKRELTPDEQASFDALIVSVAEIDARVIAIEEAMNFVPVEENSAKLEVIKRTNKKAAPMNIPAIVTDVDDKKLKRNRSNAVRGWFLKGTRGFRSEFAISANEIGLDINSNQINLEARAAQGIGSTGIGGALVNDEFYGILSQAMRDYNSVRKVATILSTSNGNKIQMPCVDDTANAGTLIAENGAISEVGLTFTNKTLEPFKFSSGQVLTSYELLQDSLIDVESLVAEQAGIRIGRIQETYFTTGTGSGQPQGLVIGAASGKVAAATNALTVDEIIDLVFSVDEAYKNTSTTNVGFMCHPSTLAAIAKLKDDNGSPIFSQNYAGADARVPTIMGYPVTLNSNMASTLAANAKVLLFGDFSKYVVRDVAGDGGITIVRQSETYATSGQIGWVAIARSGGLLLACNTTTYNPVKYLAMAAS